MYLISLSERSCNTTIVIFDEVKKKGKSDYSFVGKKHARLN